MPIVAGMCVPNICLKVEFDTTAAALAAVTQTGKSVTAPAKLQALMLLFGTAYNAALAKFATPVVLDCDACTCAYTDQNPPWTALPPYHLAIEPNSNYTVQIAGIRARVWFGGCHPAGAKIKVGNAFVPIENFKDGLLPKSSGGSGGKKGKKKPGKKKPGKRRRKLR
jgi:hypothetical protein